MIITAFSTAIHARCRLIHGTKAPKVLEKTLKSTFSRIFTGWTPFLMTNQNVDVLEEIS